MKVDKKIGGGIPWARKTDYEYKETKYESDLKDGDIIKILDSGTIEPNNFGGESKNFKIKTRNGERKLAFNQRTINVLHDEFGSDTEDWINKDVKVILHKTLIAGKKSIVPYLVTEGWKLDEYGELTKEGETKKEKEEVIEYPENDIDPEDIPF